MSMKQELKAGISALALAFALAMPGVALAEGDDPVVDDGIAWAGGSPDFCEACGGEVVEDPIAGDDGAGGDEIGVDDPSIYETGIYDPGTDGDDVTGDPRDGCENCRGDEGDGTEVTEEDGVSDGDAGSGDEGAGDGTVYDSTGFDETGVVVDDTPMEVTSTGGPDVRNNTGGAMARSAGGEGNGQMQIRSGCVSETGPTLAFLCNQ